jgi:hypothetical protein
MNWVQNMNRCVGPASWDASKPKAVDEDPHPDYSCRHDGRCQYAIDSGAEGMGHCPRGKCVMNGDAARSAGTGEAGA